MFRILVVSACILFLLVVAIMVTHSVSNETTSASAQKLESDVEWNLKGNNSSTPKEFEVVNATEELNGTIRVITEKSVLDEKNVTFNNDSITAASDSYDNKQEKVILHKLSADGNNEDNKARIGEKERKIKEIQVSIEEAEKDLQEKLRRLKEIEQRALITRKLSEETQRQFQQLIDTMNGLQNSIVQTSKAANEAFWQEQLQKAKYNTAKTRYSKLRAELERSKSDYGKMKAAVDQAAKAAKIALSNIDVSSAYGV